MTVDLEAVLKWVRSTPGQPIAANLVPGASEDERRMLSVLGGLVSGIVADDARTGWPADVLSWLADGPSAPAEIVESATRGISETPDETLAAIYAQLVAGAHRRALGTFFTPRPEVELMLEMWAETEGSPSSIVDVGAGVGVFTASAISRWPGAHVYGVDINPVTLGLLALRAWVGGLALQQVGAAVPGVRIVREDFTTWIEKWAGTPAPRLILGNPPYTRSQLMSSADRARLEEAAGGLCGARASLSALITAISLLHLEAQDGLSLLLPAQWLESQYAQPLRNHLASLDRRRVELRLVDSRLFADAQVDAVVLQVGPERPEPAEFLVATWTRDGLSHKRRVVPRDQLRDISWRTLFEGNSARSSVRGSEGADAPLSDFCRLRRGTATGANGFFVLTDEEVAENELWPWVKPLVRRLFKHSDAISAEEFDKLAVTDKRWLLTATLEDRASDSALDRYLSAGEGKQIDEAYLCRVRPGEWYDLRHDLVVPDVIVGPMTRDAMRFVTNPVGAAIVNNLYGWSWADNVTDEDRTAILNWLRTPAGQDAVLGAARSQGTGLKKIEPRALANVRVPQEVAISPHALL
ncbi:class I SAM-dependent methyltransferase [Microbacterium lacticum]